MAKRDYSPVPFKSEYSEAFKRQVVREVMCGILTKDGAKRKYNVGGNTTILRWCRKYGVSEQLGVKVRIMTQKECDETEVLRDRIRELEKSLDYERFKNEVLETYKKVLERDHGISLPKKPGAKPSGK